MKTPIEIAKTIGERFDEMEKNHGWVPEHKERIKSFITSEIFSLLTFIEDEMEKGKILDNADTFMGKIVNGEYGEGIVEGFNKSKSEDIEIIKSVKEAIK